MTRVFITIDTEYAFAIARDGGPASRADNYARSIAGVTASGLVGVGHKLATFARHGLHATFFVDPMAALVYGREAVADVVGPIVEAGQDVQLHVHTEWLELGGPGSHLPAGPARNMADLSFDDQCAVLDWARETLQRAGAPRPTAFRAGNYGANDDTLRALAAIGMTHDTSHTPGIVDGDCRIGMGPTDRHPVMRHGVVEVPVSCVETPGGLRHAQLTALSHREMLAAIGHARDEGLADFTLVSHSFELMCRQRERINRIVHARFDRLCAGPGRHAQGYHRDLRPASAGAPSNVPSHARSCRLARGKCCCARPNSSSATRSTAKAPPTRQLESGIPLDLLAHLGPPHVPPRPDCCATRCGCASRRKRSHRSAGSDRGR